MLGPIGLAAAGPLAALAGTGRETRTIRPGNHLDDVRQGGRHIFGEMTAVRARVADQFVLFIKSLRHVQRLLGTESK